MAHSISPSGASCGCCLLVALLAACGSPSPSGDELKSERLPLELVIPPPETTVFIDLEGPEPVQIRDGSHSPGKHAGDSPYGNMFLDDDNKSFVLSLAGSVEDPKYRDDRPYISGSLSYRGSRSLQLTLPPRDSDITFDRAEINVVSVDNSPSGAVVFGLSHPKYFGFAIYMHTSTTLPLPGKLNFMQAWQGGDGPSSDTGSCGVPLHATFQTGTHGAPLDFYVSSHDDGGGHEVLPATPFTLGVWHTFVFYLQPDTNEMRNTTGKVKIWFDGVLKADWDRDWGCNLSDGKYRDVWDLRVGMYRTDIKGPTNATAYMFLDNIGVASYFNGANPRPPVIW